jgi:hypothetical protein
MNSKNAVHTQHFFDVKQATENEMRVSGQALNSSSEKVLAPALLA